jgi:hypothetical protein
LIGWAEPFGELRLDEQLDASLTRGLIAGEVAPLSGTDTTGQLSPANRALIANDVVPASQQFGQANSASCIADRPC